MLTKKPFEIHSYSKSQMARFFGVSSKKWNMWMEPLRVKFPDQFPPRAKDHSHIYTPKQVGLIIDHLGEP